MALFESAKPIVVHCFFHCGHTESGYDPQAVHAAMERRIAGDLMGACERCWTQASFDARLKGGTVVDHYQRLLGENEAEHATPAAEPEETP